MSTESAFTRSKKIRFQHCDPAGMVFYPQYLVLFHELIEDWFILGLHIPYAEFISVQRMGIPTVHIECDFHSPSRLGDNLDMHLNVAKLGRTSIAFELSACHGGQRRASIRQTVVLICLDSGQPLPLPDELVSRVKPFTLDKK